jgi:hypothetical protein
LVAVDTESTPNGELSVGEARRTFLKNQTCFKIREKEKGKNRVDFCSKRLLLTSFGGQQMCLEESVKHHARISFPQCDVVMAFFHTRNTTY